MSRRLFSLLLALCLLPAGLWLSACGGNGEEDAAARAGANAGRGKAAGDRPPLILISIDTLRWDHVPAYGYEGVATPAIDAFREDALLFESAWTHTPLTLPAHASMLTGLLPPEHGVRVNMGYRLEPGLPSLPSLLREAGYATGAAVSSFVLREGTGIEHGFDFYEAEIDYRPAPGFAGYQRSGEQTLDASREWLESVADEPFFFFFHIYEPHAPYTPPEPYASTYESAYDGEIAYADAIIGELLGELRRLGVYDRAAIVITSDHGDALGDHGEEGHGMLVYRSTMQIPLLLKPPGGSTGAGGEGEMPPSVPTAVSLRDLPPTFLGYAGLAAPEAMGGRSLAEIADEASGSASGEAGEGGEGDLRQVYGETYYTRLYFGWSELRTLVDGRYQYIESTAPELYDLAADPEQATNILADNRARAARMRDRLAGIPERFQAPGEFDLETRRKLESLGYLGGARSAYEGELPPPQTQMHLARRLQEGQMAFASGRYLQAARLYQEILEENPHMIAAWENLAAAYERSGRYAAALEAYSQAYERSGNEPQLALAVGEALLTLGRFDEAVRHADLARGWNGPAAAELAARAALAQGDLARAEREAQAGLGERRDPGLLLALARVRRQQGDLAGAEDLARQAESRAAGTRVRGLYLLLGDVLARTGRVAEAEAAFQREIALFPSDPVAPGNLALLYRGTGRPAEAEAVLRELVERNPTPPAYAVAVRTLRTLELPAAEEVLAEGKRRYPGNELLDKL